MCVCVCVCVCTCTVHHFLLCVSFSQRSITELQKDTLAAEFAGLNLSRYVQEAVSHSLKSLLESS